jgi:hypothetical protein
MTADCEPAGRSLPHESDHERQVRLRLACLLASSPILPEELRPGEIAALRDVLGSGQARLSVLSGRRDAALPALGQRLAHAQPTAASASNASLLARMNSFSASGFRSTDARSSPCRPIRSRS